jgi:hypothetical protein
MAGFNALNSAQMRHPLSLLPFVQLGLTVGLMI